VKPQDSTVKPVTSIVPNNQQPTSGNGISILDVNKYMKALKKELENVLMSYPSRKGIINMGMHLTNIFLIQ